MKIRDPENNVRKYKRLYTCNAIHDVERERGYKWTIKFYMADEREREGNDRNTRFSFWSSCVGRRVDALALRAEERRDKLRKAAGSGKYTESRRYLNGATRQERLLSPCTEYIGVWREPGELKHLSSRRKRKQP